MYLFKAFFCVNFSSFFPFIHTIPIMPLPRPIRVSIRGWERVFFSN